MPFNTVQPLDRLAVLLTNAGAQNVKKGVPEAYSHKVSAFVTFVGQEIVDKAGGLLQREARYYVEIGYKVKGAEDTAEVSLAAIVDSFITGFYADRKTGLAGTAESCSLDLTVSDRPEYTPVAGSEFRVYPLVVTAVQQQNA